MLIIQILVTNKMAISKDKIFYYCDTCKKKLSQNEAVYIVYTPSGDCYGFCSVACIEKSQDVNFKTTVFKAFDELGS